MSSPVSNGRASGEETTVLWELAGSENNLPFLIPLLERHQEQVTEKHYKVSYSSNIFIYCGVRGSKWRLLFCV